jgi:hypothetical protein
MRSVSLVTLIAFAPLVLAADDAAKAESKKF